MTFKRATEGHVRVGDVALARMDQHRQIEPNAPEAGGILLGRLIVDSHDIVIDDVAVPSEHDRASRFRFFRSKRNANTVIRKTWSSSNATCIYLGEWHTHPEDTPSPSWTDLRNWRRVLRKSCIEQDFLLFAIVGRVDLRLWELTKNEPRPILLQEIQAT